MNIFVTNVCPVQSAKEHNNVHVVKMIVELAQLLSTAHYELDGVVVGYKPTHRNHPCSVWVRECSANYDWAYRHYKALCEEYTFRTGKVHKSSEHIPTLKSTPTNIKHDTLKPFAMAMPDQYKALGIFDQTKAYRAYLNDKYKEWKSRGRPMKVEWTNRNIPFWVK